MQKNEVQVLRNKITELQRYQTELEQSIKVAKANGLLYSCAKDMDERQKIIKQVQEQIEFLERQIADLKSNS